jgi:hypothetical protein
MCKPVTEEGLLKNKVFAIQPLKLSDLMTQKRSGGWVLNRRITHLCLNIK